MNKNLKTLCILDEIEMARNHLHKLASRNPLSSKVVVAASEKLDKLLNRLAKH